MNIVCKFCNTTFTRKDHLKRHLNENRCKIAKTLTLFDLHEKINNVHEVKEDQQV